MFEMQQRCPVLAPSAPVLPMLLRSAANAFENSAGFRRFSSLTPLGSQPARLGPLQQIDSCSPAPQTQSHCQAWPSSFGQSASQPKALARCQAGPQLLEARMDIADPAPRVNFEALQHHVNRRVKLVGEVTGLEGNTARVKAADGGMVSVDLVHGPSFDGQFYEFDGIVQTPDQIREVSRASFGSSFNLQLYNELCKIAATQYQQVFL